jgi:predicted anti-sigma-YlaC factor YlaD
VKTMSEHIGYLLNDYLDDELNDTEKALIEQHLFNCSYCTNQLIELTSLNQQILDAYQIVDIPDLIEDRVLAEIEQESVKTYLGKLNRVAIFVIVFFGITFLAATSPFLTVGVHIFQTTFSIGRGLIYAFPSIIAAIPYFVEVTAVLIVLLITLALLIIRFLVHNMGKTAGAEEL